MERLLRGYREFRRKRWPQERATFDALAREGQKPEYLIIACSDSRSDPATIFSGRPGEFFVVRNVAAVVPPYNADIGFYGTRSAIAYAVLGLNVRNIVVVGHAQCGGVAAALDPKSASKVPFLAQWVELLKPAIARVPACKPGPDGCAGVERSAVALSVERLLEYPFIAERVHAGTLAVDGARFAIATGKLEVMDKKSGKFRTVDLRTGFLRLFAKAA
jgi:carbonic anhydrase